MFPSYPVLRHHLGTIIANRRADGFVVDGLHEELRRLPDSYDALDDFAHRLDSLPPRSDWAYVEPETLEDIWEECDPARSLAPLAALAPAEAQLRTEAAFLGSVCGCILGKPIEVNPSLQEIREALEALGEWPLRDYISSRLRLGGKERFHEDASFTVREGIRFAAPDDDIDYTLLGMLNLEQNGLSFTHQDLKRLWLRHQSLSFCWGPERTILLRCGLSHWGEGIDGAPADDFAGWVRVWNPNDQLCGAVIRADAYGYACPGDPATAAELAWRDASFIHRKTGVYATMFVAAAIATAYVASDPLDIFRVALQYVPRRSRFFQIVSDSFQKVASASDWLEGYELIHGKYREFSHCQVYQECGTLVNTLRFATSIDDGFCKQVSQGNDTDSFGATAGSILGAFWGRDYLDQRWLAPFQDEIRTGLNFFPEHSLSRLAARIGELSARVRR